MEYIKRILAVGDLHLRRTTPVSRTDDFLATLDKKLDFIFSTARKEEIFDVLFPGDIFDRADAPYGLVEYAVHKFVDSGLNFLFVFGQHDLRYHTSDHANSPLGVLVAALKDNGHILRPDVAYDLNSFIAIYGCSWGEKPPEVLKADKLTNILVMHRPITVVPLPWDHKDLLTAKQLCELCPNVDIFITGDNHTRFVAEEPQLVVNMGSVCRQNIDQQKHKPGIAIISVSMDSPPECVTVDIPVEKSVFSEKAQEKSNAYNAKMEDFIRSIGKEFDAELSFVDNLRSTIDRVKSEGVRSILTEILEKGR